ncbi:MAG: serine/threonine protein kinase [Myxococcales bacterium]|nr:serine/threonine protein kinase [Myxococcales bacterium]
MSRDRPPSSDAHEIKRVEVAPELSDTQPNVEVPGAALKQTPEQLEQRQREQEKAERKQHLTPPPRPRRDTKRGALWSGRLRPGEELGRGATGTVLRGTDVKLRRDVALKVTRLPRGELPTQLFARFVEEAQITAQLEHPNVVPVHDFGTDPEGHAYFSMKLVRGQSLEEILARRRAGDPATVSEFGLRRLLDVFLTVCNAIEYAHAHGVIHRDLKPANIMVGDFGEVLVMDWGIAKLIGRDEPAASLGMTGEHPLSESTASKTGGDISSVREDAKALATQHGMVLGTPAYMSPEQARGLELDGRSDIYSLGVILYEILCGRVPFDSPDPVDAVSRLLVEEPTAPSKIDPRTPPTLEVLALLLLEKDRDKRTLSIRQVRSHIEDYIEGIGRAYRRESIGTNILWLVGALGLFAFLVWYLTGQSVATVVAMTPSAVFNALGWLLFVLALGYPLWAVTTSVGMSGAEHGLFKPPTVSELFVSGYLSHRTFATTVAPLFQLVFVAETVAAAVQQPVARALEQVRAEWANALIVIIVFLFAYLLTFSLEVRFARRIDRYVRLVRRRAWESIWPFALIIVLLGSVIATDALTWSPSGADSGVWAYIKERILWRELHPFEVVKTLVFQGTFLVGLVMATLVLAFPFSELLASLRLTYQAVDQASVTTRKRYFLRSLAVFRIARTNFLYAGAMIGSLTGLTILSGQSRAPLVEQVVFVLGPSLIGFIGFVIMGRKTAAYIADAPALQRMLDDELAVARHEHAIADLDVLRAASLRRRMLQLVVPLVCIAGYLIWSGTGFHQKALRELMLPVSAKGWLLILPYASLVVVLLVRHPVQVWLLRRRVRRAELAEPPQPELTRREDDTVEV